MLLTVLAVSALTGCGSKAPTAQDAQNYAKAVLDLMCTGGYDHSVKLADVEEGKELDLRDQMIDDTIASLAGDTGLNHLDRAAEALRRHGGKTGCTDFQCLRRCG